MDKKAIWQMALASGLCDADLGGGKQLITDYGDATDAVENFAALIAEKEREDCANEQNGDAVTLVFAGNYERDSGSVIIPDIGMVSMSYGICEEIKKQFPNDKTFRVECRITPNVKLSEVTP